jgi:hypothetical protein
MKGMYVFLKSRFLPLRRQETPTKSSVILQGEKLNTILRLFLGHIYPRLPCSWYNYSAVNQNLVTMSHIYEMFAEGKSQEMNISKYC